MPFIIDAPIIEGKNFEDKLRLGSQTKVYSAARIPGEMVRRLSAPHSACYVTRPVTARGDMLV